MANNSIFEFASCSDLFIWQLNFTDAQYICYKSACYKNVFDIVEKMQPIGRAELIQQAKYGKRGGEAVINVITALGLLKCVDGKYYLTEISRNYLTASSAYSWRAMLNMFPEKFQSEIEKLDSETYVDETGIINEWDAGEIDAESAAKFTKYMQGSHISASNGFARNVSLSQFGVRRLLDVGAGSGCFSIAAAHHQPGVRAVLFDLEPVCKVAQTFIAKSGLEEGRVVTYPGNMFKEEYPLHSDPKYGYEGVFFSNIFHDWSETKCKYLAKKTYDALPENGMIFLHEALLNEDGNGPLITACFSFHMFMVTEGKQFTFTELKTLLNEAGFKDIGVIPTYGIFSVVYGRK